MYGEILLGNVATMSRSYFTRDSLLDGNVKYVCNLSPESHVRPEVVTLDSFVVIARLASRDKQSQPKTVYVRILPPNKAQPVLVNHRVLHVVTGWSRGHDIHVY